MIKVINYKVNNMMEKDGIFMYCKRCGKKINDEWKYCPYCKESLTEENIGHDEMENKNMINKVNNEVKIYSLIFIISMICTFAIYKYFYIFFLVSLITIAIGFIKYPFNNIIKLLFKIFIVFCIICVLLIVTFIFGFISLISSFGSLL
ncbi:MAG TPA: zinc ribbon domain-containing protein [Bacilli bacterium]|nr:zinc ribbon domain-containing protein [Bacilli bacterium]